MKKLLVLICFCTYAFSAKPQGAVYTTSNAHSHNDYEQQHPFWAAYNEGFGSIEADIFLINGSDDLFVAHTLAELAIKKRRLDSLYLIPIVECIRKNHGTPFSDKGKKLQILVDIKTSARPTLDKLVETIKRYPELTSTPGLQFAISGNRPGPDSFTLYPSYIVFDGEFDKTYSKESLAKVVLMSANLRNYTSWNGNGDMPETDHAKLSAAIEASHKLNKPVRFWNAPDNSNAWNVFMNARVDFINTDHIRELAEFLRKAKKPIRS